MHREQHGVKTLKRRLWNRCGEWGQCKRHRSSRERRERRMSCKQVRRLSQCRQRQWEAAAQGSREKEEQRRWKCGRWQTGIWRIWRF